MPLRFFRGGFFLFVGDAGRGICGGRWLFWGTGVGLRKNGILSEIWNNAPGGYAGSILSFRGILRSAPPVLSGGRRCACPIGGRKDCGVFIVLKRNRASENDVSLKPDCFSASSENRLPSFAGGEKVVWIIVEPGNSMAGSASCGEFLPVGLVATLLPGIVVIPRFFAVPPYVNVPSFSRLPFVPFSLRSSLHLLSGYLGALRLLSYALSLHLSSHPRSISNFSPLFYLPVGRLAG